MSTKRVYELEVGKCYKQVHFGILGQGIFTIERPIKKGLGLHRVQYTSENYVAAKRETEEVVTSEYSEFVEV